MCKGKSIQSYLDTRLVCTYTHACVQACTHTHTHRVIYFVWILHRHLYSSDQTCTHSVAEESLKIALEPLYTAAFLPPLDIFGSICSGEGGAWMSQGGRRSNKSNGSPPTSPCSKMLHSRSTHMWRLAKPCVFPLLHNCVYLDDHETIAPAGSTLL